MKFVGQYYVIQYPRTPEDWTHELRMIERAARISRGGLDSKDVDRRFIASLVNRGHWSPIEFGHAIVFIRTNRAIANELTRHRLCSFMQESTRYVDYTEQGMEFCIGCDDYDATEEERQFFEQAEKTYREQVAEGMGLEFARDMLPLGLATSLYINANFREWHHIFAMRCSQYAHPMMQELMCDIRSEFVKYVPEVFA